MNDSSQELMKRDHVVPASILDIQYLPGVHVPTTEKILNKIQRATDVPGRNIVDRYY